MIECIIKEIETRVAYLNNKTISSIYFGGGTPSILNKKELQSILNTIYTNFTVTENVEITLECNPDDLNDNKLVDFKKAGINRLSIGIQSFDNADLQFMNRSHNAQEAELCVELATKHGFQNITIDLIYGLPNQSVEAWEKNLDKMFRLGVNHFSAYALTIEPKTALKHLIDKKKINPIDDAISVQHFNALVQLAEKNGFVQYEISNFGKEDSFSQHNTAYWKGIHYLGIGPSAHSYNGTSRQWNIASNKQYIQKVNTKKDYFEIEILTMEQQYNEYLFTSLRTIWGVKNKIIKSSFGKKIQTHFLIGIEKWLRKDYIEEKNGTYNLTKNGKAFADAIASDLFIVT